MVLSSTLLGMRVITLMLKALYNLFLPKKSMIVVITSSFTIFQLDLKNLAPYTSKPEHLDHQYH